MSEGIDWFSVSRMFNIKDGVSLTDSITARFLSFIF